MEVMEETRFGGLGWDLKDRQYLDSGVKEGFLGLGLRLGFTGKVLAIWDSAIGGRRVGTWEGGGATSLSIRVGGFITRTRDKKLFGKQKLKYYFVWGIVFWLNIILIREMVLF